MSRTVPAPLQTHLNGTSTTTTRIVKIILKSGVTYGLAMLDRTIAYDDGFGEIDYIATNGFDPSTLSADIGYSVDNAEGYALISDGVPGITLEMAERGELDDAKWICYLINFESLSDGHVILDGGDLGEVRTRYGMIWIPEFLSYIMRLRQPIGSVWSRLCRAIFGTPADSQTGCGIDLTSLWVNGEVLDVGAETDRVFDGDVVSGDSPLRLPVPGRIEWLTGNNTGQESSVEKVTSDVTIGYTIELIEPTVYPIEPGDTYRIRRDCAKQYLRDCIGEWNNGINFKGEPLIPVGDAASNQVPGGQLPGGGGWASQVIEEAIDELPEP